MSRFTTVALSAVVVCGVGAAIAFRGRDAAPLAAITDLEPYDVRSAGFALDAPTEVQVHAIGAEKPRPRGLLGMLGVAAPRWLRDDERQDAWVGNAWILDARTRQVVWELRTEERADEDDGLSEFEGDVRLPRGTYEVYYASLAVPYRRDDGQWSRRDRKLADDFAVTVTGPGRSMTRDELARERRAAGSAAIVALTGVRDGETRQSAFALDREAEVRVYAVGEAREDESFDRGWIIDANTRRVVWTLDWEHSQPAGGASKNRMARQTLRLPAGRYAAFFATDDSHGPERWNSPPPLDPEFYGLTITLADPSLRGAVHAFAYEYAPSKAAMLRMVGVRDGEMRAEGFTLARDTPVRVYALGERGGDDMADYAWLTDMRSGDVVWRMTAARTVHAGGGEKNRMVDTVLALKAGAYVLRYRADDSHASNDWNAAAPTDGASWGVTLLTADGEAPAPSLLVPTAVQAPEGVIAQVEHPREGQTDTAPFTLAGASDVEVRAMGEGVDEEMVDYAWIEDARGRVVWTMAYDQTRHAGGADKNRELRVRLHLAAGVYRLRYTSDDSHGAGDWNAAPPDAPEAWGVVLRRVK